MLFTITYLKRTGKTYVKHRAERGDNPSDDSYDAISDAGASAGRSINLSKDKVIAIVCDGLVAESDSALLPVLPYEMPPAS